MESKFDNIRPYTDSEAAEALKRVAESESLKNIVDFVFGPGKEAPVRMLLSSLNSIDEFQAKVMADVVRSIIKKTSTELIINGVENVKNGHKHLLLSNHRDIVLDPAIIQLVLFENGLSTTEVAAGDNLIASPLIEDIFRSNRMVKVIRGGSPKETYTSSVLLSEYIRECIESDRCGLWIAHRNGRAKDGLDKTSQGVLKMLAMSGSGDFIEDFASLSIIPVGISYQFEPCDFMKALELYKTARDGKYVKAPGEDTASILKGISQNKGGICLTFAPEISRDEIVECGQGTKNDRFLKMGDIIDERIHAAYKLWDNNYIAYDMLHGTDSHADKYDDQAKRTFVDYMEKGLSEIVQKDPSVEYAKLKEIYLSIYANPIAQS